MEFIKQISSEMKYLFFIAVRTFLKTCFWKQRSEVTDGPTFGQMPLPMTITEQFVKESYIPPTGIITR